jgi:uncharacterized protein (TIGR02246 family)
MTGHTLSPVRRLPRWWRLLVLSISVSAAVSAFGADKKAEKEKSAPAADKKVESTSKEGEAAIRATADAFVKAFNAGDAKAVADLWTPNGTATDADGNVFKGRKAIEDQYAGLFKAHPTAHIDVMVKSIDFPTPSTAIEDGITQVVTKDNAPPTGGRYTAVHVQEDGKWLMANVHETSMPVASNFAQLEGLGWLVGEWQLKAPGVISHNKVHWIANKSFLERDYSVHRDGLLASSGKWIIGWDPQSHRIMSWCFDSSGGYGTGVWTEAPDGWRIEASGVTADGVPTSSKDHLIRVPGEDNVLGWRSVDRRLGDSRLPDTNEVVLDRVPEKH